MEELGEAGSFRLLVGQKRAEVSIVVAAEDLLEATVYFQFFLSKCQ